MIYQVILRLGGRYEEDVENLFFSSKQGNIEYDMLDVWEQLQEYVEKNNTYSNTKTELDNIIAMKWNNNEFVSEKYIGEDIDFNGYDFVRVEIKPLKVIGLKLKQYRNNKKYQPFNYSWQEKENEEENTPICDTNKQAQEYIDNRVCKVDGKTLLKDCEACKCEWGINTMIMKTIKKIKKGKYTFKHTTYRDDFGIKRDWFEVEKTCKNGKILIYPVTPNCKIFKKTDDIMDSTNQYTNEEYNEIFNKFILNIKKTGG